MINIKLFYFAVILLFAALSCKKKDANSELEPGIIENQIFNNTVLIDGHTYDGTVIRNCTFEDVEGDGLQIRDVVGLCIENCIFKNISENAIRFRNSGSSDGVKIIKNEIYNIKQNGILAPENHINTVIKGNTIYNVATSNTSSQFGAPHHGIYFQGINVLITENTIYDINNDQGNCVSIRTSGTVSRNLLHNATDHGISYFSDHPANEGALLIENNIIYDNGKRGINLASDGTVANHIGSTLIQFNSILSKDKSPIGLGDDLSDVLVDITGNILIRTDGLTNYIFGSIDYSNSYNLESATDIGFVNFTGRDLHIKSSSSANGFAQGAIEFPSVDFDSDTRLSSELDAGADEID
ncbi:MAG: right-handed parallel beta-helix repeat-containing protein [Crocinitomicaceae bacterium]